MLVRCGRLLLVATIWHAISTTEASPPQTITGSSLGTVPDASSLVSNKPGAVANAKAAAVQTLKGILSQHWSASGNETILVTSDVAVEDGAGDIHVRFQQHIQGKPIEGASMVMHLKSNGTVYAVNGEFTAGDKIPKAAPQIGCEAAVETARQQLQQPKDALKGTWVSKCELGAVQPQAGPATLAFKRLIQWTPSSGEKTAQKAFVYASVVDGALVAFQPQSFGARALETYNCLNQWIWDPSECVLVSNSANAISTADPAVNDAHNFAIKTYDYLKERYSRDSFDNFGSPIVSLTHVGSNFSNAFFSSCCPPFLGYGDGDGVTFTYFSKALDVVAHEIAHGVTEYSSGLWYYDESGALNEAFSDIMGAAVERFKGGKVEAMVWEIGEDLNVVDNTVGFRNMADPMKRKNPDFYFDRYRGYLDNGGVHWNSGIIHLAFYLMVKGGTHPRSKSTVVVPAIDASDFDASLQRAVDIFYYANVGCLTPWSTFQDALYCTKLFAGGDAASVSTAWEAVGVRPVLALEDGVPLTGQALSQGSHQEYLFLTGRGYGYMCETEGSTGDADLYSRSYVTPDPFPFAGETNDCTSVSNPESNELCYAASLADTPVWVLLKASESYSDVTLTCSTLCQSAGDYCYAKSECCSYAADGFSPLTCDGPEEWNRKCKKCKGWNKACTRKTECCSNRCNKNGRCA